mmetsp:Transcript_15374/g.36313  ORF Transcript_15374/g.36313 Transcript_15374/m.36313 type:complete len:267 (-) Transcript_15374:347-1147(-)|eukprot:CAMPEP_0114547484 /NCGR_PEP_ID=MMETSP0114-20121206/4488_1 /TAXON_ID=31324 /ORGANISM="Goniomonas sp, Strain m" /LENGTH=266 /DNA_ID=CAMNT_0001732041 /DNA_START=29 /DNA_END=829 /DNA_ORIENTATION=+
MAVPLHDGPLRVCSWNILAHIWVRKETEDDYRARLVRIASRVSLLEPDLVFLQEAQRDAIDYILSENDGLELVAFSSHSERLWANWRVGKKFIENGNAVLARRGVFSGPITVRSVQLSADGNIGVVVAGETVCGHLAALNVHLEVDPTGKEQADQLTAGLRSLDNCSSPGGLKLLCGDLNSTENSSVLRHLAQTGWPSARNPPKTCKGFVLDWVLCHSHLLMPENVQVSHPARLSRQAATAEIGSDHVPVVCLVPRNLAQSVGAKL